MKKYCNIHFYAASLNIRFKIRKDVVDEGAHLHSSYGEVGESDCFRSFLFLRIFLSLSPGVSDGGVQDTTPHFSFWSVHSDTPLIFNYK